MFKRQTILAGAAVFALGGGSAIAGFTTGAGGTGSEPDAFIGVLNTITYLGQAGWAASGNDRIAGGYTLKRVDDFGKASPIPLQTGTAGPYDDDTWVDGTASFVAEAKFAANDHEFGFNSTPLILSTQAAFTSGTPVGPTLVGPGAFTWYLKNTSGPVFVGDMYSSDPTANPDGADHMVTFEVTGPSITSKTWLLWWEDVRVPGGDNIDYQDVVIEVRVVAVPLPAAAVLGLPLLGGVIALGLKSRREQAI